MDESDVRDILEEFDTKPRKVKDPTNIDTKSRKYWEKIFKIMDEYGAVPLHKREGVLQDVLSEPMLLNSLRHIYDITPHPDIIDFKKILSGEEKKERPPSEKRQAAFVDYDETKYSPKTARARKSQFLRPPSNVQGEPRSTVDYRKELTRVRLDSELEGDSMYASFLKKTPEKASRWRPKPPLTLEGMSLGAKCDELTRDIATNFVQWMESLGGEANSSLDVESIENLFEIGFNCHSADSLKVNIQELNSVTEYVAHARQTPELSFATQLYRQLYRDKTAVTSKAPCFAFGTMLPPEMRSGTTDAAEVDKWLENKRVPTKIATMAVVWEDIVSLKSTEGYCNWLKKHENIAPPSYLVNKGKLSSKKKDTSITGLNTSPAAQSRSRTSNSTSVIVFK